MLPCPLKSSGPGTTLYLRRRSTSHSKARIVDGSVKVHLRPVSSRNLAPRAHSQARSPRNEGRPERPTVLSNGPPPSSDVTLRARSSQSSIVQLPSMGGGGTPA